VSISFGDRKKGSHQSHFGTFTTFRLWCVSARSLLSPKPSCFCVRFPSQLQEPPVMNKPINVLCVHDPTIITRQTHHKCLYAPEQNHTTWRKARNRKGIKLYNMPVWRLG